MVPVDSNLRVGDIVGIRKRETQPAPKEEKGFDAMHFVDEKDL